MTNEQAVANSKIYATLMRDAFNQQTSSSKAEGRSMIKLTTGQIIDVTNDEIALGALKVAHDCRQSFNLIFETHITRFEEKVLEIFSKSKPAEENSSAN